MGVLDSAYIGLMNKTYLMMAAVDVNEIANGGEGGGTFSEVYTATQTLGQDVYSTLMLIGGFGGVIMLIIAFLYFMIAGSGQNKQEAKSKIVVVLLAVAGIFAAIFLVGLAQKIGEGLAGTGGGGTNGIGGMF